MYQPAVREGGVMSHLQSRHFKLFSGLLQTACNTPASVVSNIFFLLYGHMYL